MEEHKVRLIDAEAFKRYVDCGHLRPQTEICFSEIDVVSMIDRQPAVDAVPVVRCKECVYWTPRHVKMNDGTIRFCEPNEGIVTIEKGINVGSYCKRFDDVTVHGYRDGEPCIDKTKAWCNQDDFCSYGERKNNGNEDRA